MNTVAIVQARLGSTRLPGKVLADVCGEPMIARQMARLERAEQLDGIAIAVPQASSDDSLAGYCMARGWLVYRGSEYDVLDRYLAAAEWAEADTVVRVTADCPLIDPFILDRTVLLHRLGSPGGPFDFTANNLVPTFPHGLDVEVMSRGTLAIAAAKATAPHDREHVTSWITRADAGGQWFRLGNLPSPVDLSMYRLTVDYPEDLALVRSVYQALGGRSDFTTADVLAILGGRPELIALNARYRQHAQPMGRA